MTTLKYLLIPTITASLLLLAGCSIQPTTNTDVVTNTNTTNDNANVETVTNTNTELGSEVDTSDLSSGALAQEDWLTYTNEEYGFSFKYPKVWGIVKMKESNDSAQGKEKFYLTFSENVNSAIDNKVSTPTIILSSVNYEDKKEGDVPNDVNMNLIDFSQSNDDLKNIFLNSVVKEVDLERLEIDGIMSLRVTESGQNMAGEYLQIKYYFPNALQQGLYHITFIQGATDINQFDATVKTLKML